MICEWAPPLSRKRVRCLSMWTVACASFLEDVDAAL